MDKNWTAIFSSGNLQKAELVRNLLEHNDISSVIINQQDSFYKFGEIKVYVNREDVVKAKYCLAQTLPEEDGFN